MTETEQIIGEKVDKKVGENTIKNIAKQPSKPKLILFLFVIIALLVVIIAGGIFWYFKQSAEQNQNTVTTTPTQSDGTLTPATSENACKSQSAETGPSALFDSHVHISSKVSISQIISEMDKAGVSVANLYSGTLENSSQYPGRFITFVDTPDSPQPSTWLTQGQAFVTAAEAKLKTGKYYGIGEANLRYFGGTNYPPGTPDINVSPDNPIWLELVDLSAKYQVPISFHFVPDDVTSNVAFEKMLNHNKDAIIIWAHLGFNNLMFNSTTLNDFLLRYPHLFFDTAGIQGMQNPISEPNSNWTRITNPSTGQGGQNQGPSQSQVPGQSQGPSQGPSSQGQDTGQGQANEEWKKFFETWNTRIMFASDAGGGKNSLERWLNYSSNISTAAPSDSIGHWKRLLSNLDLNSSKNILSGNAGALFLKEQKPPYNYSVSADGKCYTILISSNSSVSALKYDSSKHTITFTVANSTETTGNAEITIPITLISGDFTASVDGQNVESQSTSNSTSTIISLEYAGGIKSITLNVPDKF